MLIVPTLGTSLDALLFHANDSLSEQLSCKPRVGTEALPVAATISRSAQWTSDRTKSNMSSLPDELISHVLSANMSQISVPRSCNGQTGRENRSVVSLSDSQWAILQAEAVETQTINWPDVSDARSCGASDQSDLLFQCQLRDKVAGLLECGFPSGTGGIRCEMR
jgi:hypothetical protein